MESTIGDLASPSSTRGPYAEAARSTIGQASDHLSQVFITKGILALAFGVVLLAWPKATIGVVVLLFGTFAIVDGVVAIWQAVTTRAAGERWVTVLYGLLGIAAGIAVYVWPAITALALLYVFAIWATVGGVLGIVAAAVGSQLSQGVRLLLGLGGLTAVVFGIGILIHPGAGAVALSAVVAAMALIVGVAFLGAGIKLRRASRAHTDETASPVALPA